MNTKLNLLIIFQFISLLTWGQLTSSKLFYSKDGFCSTSILLDSLGNFYREGGCEGRSTIGFGTYKLKGDIVEFNFQSFNIESPVFDIQKQSPSLDSIITVTFLSRQGNPIPNTYFSVDAIDTSGKFFQTFKLNEFGQVKMNFKVYKELRLDYLENIYLKKVRIPVNSNDITVTLNLPQLFFYYQRPSPVTGNNFSLLIKNDVLYDKAGKEKVFSVKE